MFLHQHPYKPFIPKHATRLIVGTLPPPRFSIGELLKKDVNFCYGSYYNSLWLYIDRIHNLNLLYDNSNEAVEERKQFLIERRIGICDIVESCERNKIDASDLGMQNIKLRDIISYLKQYPKIDMLLFTGGNSKNGPEYFFRKQLKEYNIKLEVISIEVPRINNFILPVNSNVPIAPDSYRNRSEKSHHENKISLPRTIKTVSLTSASGSANRAIGSMPLYRQFKAENPKFTTFDFRVMQYREFL